MERPAGDRPGRGCRYRVVTLKVLVRLRRVVGLVDSRSVPGRAGSIWGWGLLGAEPDLLLSGQQHHDAAGSPAAACRAEDWKGNWSGLALLGPKFGLAVPAFRITRMVPGAGFEPAISSL